MKRRDFIKTCSICAFSGLFLSGCCNENIVKDGDDKWVKHIEIPICYHCNLDCACCDHFAPLAPVYEMPVDVFKKDMKQFAKITKNKVKEIFLIGGEPTLHKQIEKLMEISRHYFPHSDISIITNGLLLNKMSENFWKACGKNKIHVCYTKYIKCEYYPENFDVAEANAQKFNAVLKEYRPCETFTSTQLSTKPIFDNKVSYQKCWDKVVCSLLDNGNLYTCAMSGSIKFLNNYFKDKQMPVFEEDSLNIYKLKSIDEILEFYEKPKKICSYCGYYVNMKIIPWHHTKRISSEWYIET